MRSVADRHEKALQQWQRWKQARTRREREDALIQLRKLCDPEIAAAIKKLADRLSEGWSSSATVPVWLSMHGWTFEDARQIAYFGVALAARGFEPAKGTFQTYAFPFILGELHAAVV